MRAHEFISEVVDLQDTYPRTWYRNEAVFGHVATRGKYQGQKIPMYVTFGRTGIPNTIIIDFGAVLGGQNVLVGLTGSGNEFRVFNTIAVAVLEYLDKHPDVNQIFMIATDERKRHLYAQLARSIDTTRKWQMARPERLDAESQQYLEHHAAGLYPLVLRRRQVSEQQDTIRLPEREHEKAWIRKVYDQFPKWPYGRGDRVMVWGEGEDQQFAVFALKPALTKNTVEVDWFQAHPQRQGVGTRAMKELQRLAQQDGISLSLWPWDKGQISQGGLKKFYKSTGFNPISKGANSMEWNPEVKENFADGKGPGRPGDSQRHGIPKKATMAQLEKASHAKGRKGQLARWQLNMRRGKKKHASK